MIFFNAIQEAYHIENEETVIKIPFENIIEVNGECLIYKNLDGVPEKINLDDCVRNFNLAFGKEPKNHLGKIVKVVGGRFFLEPVAFYEFFTNTHHIRFCMTLKQTPLKKILRKIGWNAYQKEYLAFYSLQKTLNATGYATVDLT